MSSIRQKKLADLIAIPFLPIAVFAAISACGAVNADQVAKDAGAHKTQSFLEPDEIDSPVSPNLAALPLQRFDLGEAVNGMAYVNDPSALAISLNREILLLDTGTGEVHWRNERCSSCSSVHLTRSEDGSEIVMPSRARDGGAVYDVSSGEKLRDLTGPGVRAAGAPDGSETLSVLDREAVLETAGDGRVIWRSGIARIGALGYDPGGKHFVISTDGDGTPRKGGKVWIYDAGTRTVETQITYERASFNHLAFAPEGDRLILASYKHRVLVWDMVNDQALCRFDSDQDGMGLRAIELSPDGRLIAAAGGTDNWGYARIWDAETCALRAETIFNGRVSGLSFHPNLPKLAAGGWSGELVVMDLTDLYLQK